VLINAGNIIKANDLVLTTINQIVPIYVSFALPEQNLAEIKKHMATRELKVEAIVPHDEKRPARGQLTFIDNAVDRTTGTIRLKGTFENRDRRLWPGQFVDVVLTLTTEKNRVIVPSQAVQTGQQGQYVYVIKDDMTAEFRLVIPERTYERWIVVDKGVDAGERVVIDGQLRLVPGAKVELKNEATQKNLATEAQGRQSKAEQNTKAQMPQSKESATGQQEAVR
jgi:multidrug efflux system membrane fusion protein